MLEPGTKVLITGASGSLGVALHHELRESGIRNVFRTDKDTMDVRDQERVASVIANIEPDVIFHLAGAKHAPEGELSPWAITEINVGGTQNVIEAVQGLWLQNLPSPRIVLASTCKACDPETAYGATKLIAERMVLNAGGSVARFYNVRETCGNVFETWRDLPEGEFLSVTPCARFFMSVDDAIHLLLYAATASPGRYVYANPARERMSDVAQNLYPGRRIRMILPRRGDRLVEPRYAASETRVLLGRGIARVTSPHDPVREPVAA